MSQNCFRSIIVRFLLPILSPALLLCSAAAHGELRVQDDLGDVVTLQRPAQRIISLAPHIAELLYEAGATNQLVGTVEYSDYPPVARSVPRIGSFSKFDFEAIAALRPDLVIAWHSGNPGDQVQAISQLGLPIFYSEPEKLEQVALAIERFGVLLGTQTTASREAETFRRRLAELAERYKDRSRLRVFYQVWQRPLMTVNGQHIISDVIELCGGVNVFAELPVIAPHVDVESVLKKNPQVIIAGVNQQRQQWLGEWMQWDSISAVRHRHVYGLDPDTITRHTSRILSGAQQVCDFIEKARH
jgi:iron complex transport system substrate-binding protein